jgi:hypothetical protein
MLTTHIHLVPGFNMSGAVPLPHLRRHGVDKEYFTIIFHRVLQIRILRLYVTVNSLASIFILLKTKYDYWAAYMAVSHRT